MTVKELRSEVDRRRGKEQLTVQNLDKARERVIRLRADVANHEDAREVVKQAGLKTQETLAFHISDITSLALEAVFSDPYKLSVNFVQRRNKTECDLLFARNDDEVSPMDASGGGAVDVAAFALRVASWSMQTPRTEPVLVLDEPMRFLSTDLQPKASEMLKEISEKLGLQFIIITHEELLTEEAAQVIEVSKPKQISKVS